MNTIRIFLRYIYFNSEIIHLITFKGGGELDHNKHILLIFINPYSIFNNLLSVMLCI